MLPFSSVWIYTCNSTKSLKLNMWPNHRIEDTLAKRHIIASKKLHLVRILNKFQNQYTGQSFILLKHCNEQAILPEHIKCSKHGIQKIRKWNEIFHVKVACLFPTKDMKCVKNMMMRYQCHILYNCLWPMKCPSISNIHTRLLQPPPHSCVLSQKFKTAEEYKLSV